MWRFCVCKRLSVAITAFTIGVLVVIIFAETALGEIARDGLVAEYHLIRNEICGVSCMDAHGLVVLRFI